MFFKRVERLHPLAFMFISCIRQAVAQELNDNRIYVLYPRKFCRRPTAEVGVLEQSRYSASIEHVLVHIWNV